MLRCGQCPLLAVSCFKGTSPMEPESWVPVVQPFRAGPRGRGPSLTAEPFWAEAARDGGGQNRTDSTVAGTGTRERRRRSARRKVAKEQ